MRMNDLLPLPEGTSEHHIQSAYIRWVRAESTAEPGLRLLFATPNAAKRNFKEAASLRAEGMKSGVPDLMLPLPRGGYCGLAIEFKKPKTGKLSPEQIEYIADLEMFGRYRVVICTCHLDAIEKTQSYLALMG